MNRVRLEYYFARFRSAMEVRARYGVAPIDLGAQKIVNLFPNLFFIGTINVDETTHGFADKIYDRAQLIELTAPRDGLAAYIAGEPYCDLVMSVWDAVHEVAPFAFRVLEEIKVYINAARDLGQNWEVALDEQILQKTLPKCKGADLRVGEALMKLKAILPAETFPLSHAKVQRMIEGFQKYGFASYF